ncbi:MAG: hypothetical protein RJB61_1690 [Actinomycetota bacterium]
MKRSVLAIVGTLGAAVAIPVVMSGAFAAGDAPDAALAPSAAEAPVLVSVPVKPSPDPKPGDSPSIVHGNPHVVMFAVEWRLSTGSSPADLDTVLPAGWRTSFSLEAAGRPGSGGETTATCHYEPTEETAMCVYSNAGGHEVEHGMNVPRSPKAVYAVSVSGLPTGWTADPDTVGEFSMRTACPKAAKEVSSFSGLAAAKNDKLARGCLHTVIIKQGAAASPTTLAPTTTAAESSPPLPTAGSSTAAAAFAAMLLVGAGMLTRRLARRTLTVPGSAGPKGLGGID